jgi:hypothetical protein
MKYSDFDGNRTHEDEDGHGNNLIRAIDVLAFSTSTMMGRDQHGRKI